MTSGGQEPSRHQPLPGVLGLPGYLYRRLSRAKKIALALTAVVLVVAAGVAVPFVRDSKREKRAQDRREAEESRAERRRELIAEQRPRTGRSDKAGLAAAVRSIQGEITADVSRRVQEGELDTPARRTECRARDVALPGGRELFSCTAVTSDIEKSEFSSAAVVGYLYNAGIDRRTGAFTFCKVAGRPGEGSYTRQAVAALDEACGG